MKYQILLLIYVLLSSESSYGQIWEKFNLEIAELNEKGNYIQAIDIAEKAVKQAEVEFGVTNEKYGLSLNNLGFLYHKLHKYDEALKIYNEALVVYKNTISVDNPRYFTTYNNLSGLYVEIGQYDNALILGLEMQEELFKVASKDNSFYGLTILNLSGTYYRMGTFEKALSLGLESKEILEKLLKKDDPNYLSCVNNLVGLYVQLGDYEKAFLVSEEALRNIKIDLGIYHSHYGIMLKNLSVGYTKKGQYNKALPLVEELVTIAEKTVGIEHPEYAERLNDLAMLHYYMGQYDKALFLFKEVLTNTEKILGKDNADYGTRMNNLAAVYQALGQYDKASPLFEELLTIIGKVLGKVHPDYGRSLNNLAGIYRDMGQYGKALPLYQESLIITEKIAGKENSVYGRGLNNLALLYYKMGQYHKALPLYQEAIEIVKKFMGNDHFIYTNIVINLAGLYSDIGQYSKSILLLEEALATTEKVQGKVHPDYGRSLNNLANLYFKVGLYDKALELYNDALVNIDNNLGKSHPNYANILNNLSILHLNIGQNQKALLLCQEAMQITEKALGKEHPEYSTRLNNLGLILSENEQYFKALPLFEDAIKITEKLVGREHSDFGIYLNNIVLFYLKLGENAKAFKFIQEAIKSAQNQIERNFTFLSENDKGQFFRTVSINFDTWRSFFSRYYTEKPEVSINAYHLELMTKGILLKYGMQMRNLILSSGNLKAKDLFDEWLNFINLLTKEYGKPIISRRSDIKELEDKAEILEAELARISSSYNNFKKLHSTQWQDIQANLKQKELAIEFSTFTYKNKKTWTDSILYVALILRPHDSLPQMITLFEQRQLDSLLVRKQDRESNHVNNFYRKKRLYELLWKPIEKFVKPGDQIYFSPSGSLHQINLGALTKNDTVYLSDLYSFYQVGSTAILASEKKVDKPVKDIAIFGGIDFDAKDEDISLLAKEIEFGDEMVSRSLYLQDSTRSGKWTYLNGTLDEAKNIRHIAEYKNISSQSYTGGKAIEERYKSLSGKNAPTVLHIATHGFFFPDPKVDKKQFELNSFQQNNIFTISDNPMSRTGLLLAGGNKSWVGDSLTTDREDGILTAYEVSNTSLFNTELVVLSACETGLGIVKGSEGVYGLQRAYKQAGVRYLMMSLWKVPDLATKDFMTTFYTEYLTNQKSVREAFNITQTKMKNKYRNEPYKWGGFVLME